MTCHGPNCAHALDITPFRTANRSPLTQLYGLPSLTTSDLLPAGHWGFSLTQDLASSYTAVTGANEVILLDGELYRWTLNATYALTDHLELGVELPCLLQGGGFLDGFIIDWHRMFGLPQGGRDTAPKNRLNYRYSRNGVDQFDMSHGADGVGDMSLLAGYRLYARHDAHDSTSVALRAQIKFPTGDSAGMLGSGGTDLALFITGAMNSRYEWGTAGIFASAGGMYSGDGDILRHQRRNFVGFGTAGVGLAPADWIAFKVQVNFNTAFYGESSLRELGSDAILLTTGGTLKLPDNYLLDIGVGEDIAVATAPDVTFNLGLSKRF
jgi:hypothetical protein